MKIEITFGRKNKHSMAARNSALEVQVQALTEALKKRNSENEELRDQLKEALQARVSAGHRFKENGVGLSLMNSRVPVPVIQKVPARFQLVVSDIDSGEEK